MRGAEAARLFYDTERFQRSGATPAQNLRLLASLLKHVGHERFLRDRAGRLADRRQPAELAVIINGTRMARS